MITCIWTGHTPTVDEVAAESRLLAARGGAEYLREQLAKRRGEFSAAQVADIEARIGRYDAEAEHQAEKIKQLQVAR